jgi:hypothetical protein
MGWEGLGKGERDAGRVLSQPRFAFPQPQSATTSCSETLQPTPSSLQIHPPTSEHDVTEVSGSVCLYQDHIKCRNSIF